MIRQQQDRGSYLVSTLTYLQYLVSTLTYLQDGRWFDLLSSELLCPVNTGQCSVTWSPPPDIVVTENQ